MGNLVSQDNLVFITGIFKVNLHLVDKADNLVNLVLHHNNLEQDGAGWQVAVEVMEDRVLQVGVEAGPGYHVAVP